MNEIAQFTNRCACGWEVSGSEDVVVDATIDHGRRIHNMEATRDQVLAVLRGSAGAGAGAGARDPGARDGEPEATAG
jgi:predicted small metal-binding protein